MPSTRMALVFESDGDRMPAGQYLVEVWSNGIHTIAWRRDRHEAWGPPIAADEDDTPW